MPGYVLVQDDCEPPPLKATFDGWTEKLAYFLNQVWNYLDQYGADFHDKGAIVNAITVNLEKEATEWVVALHDEGDENWEMWMPSWKGSGLGSETPHRPIGWNPEFVPLSKQVNQ